jgi:Zn-dependent protease/predicted transcriptional regulator
VSAAAARRPRRNEGVFSSTIRLGHVAGIQIGINWTWLGIFALIVWSLAGVEFPADAPGRSWPVYLAMGVFAAAAFFGSLILHELGHALQARREGVRTEGITLWLFGGVAKIAGEFPSAGAEFRIAIAGPLVTLGLCVAALLGTAVWPEPGAVRSVLAWLGYINAALLVFNLVPALPLDGGRVLRALLWARTRDLATATHRATRVGSVLATMLIALGILETLQGAFGGLWLALIGWFVLEAGRAEEQHVATRDALHGATVGMLMTRAPITVDARESLADVAEQVHGTARHTAYPVVADGTLIGLLPLHTLATTAHAEWGFHIVEDVMVPADAVAQLTPETPAVDAAELLADRSAGRGVVLDRGRLVGILSLSDVVRALAAGRPV